MQYPHIAYIGLGSNLDDPVAQIRQAIAALENLPHSELEQVSSLYRSAPMGPQGQPDYINAVAKLKTTLQPLELLSILQAIENDQGRVRTIRWGARTLDLDVLLFDDLEMQSERLTIPHPGLAEREFVVIPLAEIAKQDLHIPNVGELADLKPRFQQHRLERLKTAA